MIINLNVTQKDINEGDTLGGSCPVARSLRRKLPKTMIPRFWNRESDSNSYWVGGDAIWIGGVKYSIPDFLKSFINQFDNTHDTHDNQLSSKVQPFRKTIKLIPQN